MYNEQGICSLRPHHGMCLAYFEGKGYSDNFTAHMQAVLEELETGKKVRITAGTDEICGECPNNCGNGKCRDNEKVKRFDLEVLKRCGLKEGDVLAFRDFAGMVQKQILGPEKRDEICGDCQWEAVCSSKKSRWIQFTEDPASDN